MNLMNRIVMKKNANEIDVFSVREKANVREERMHNGKRRGYFSPSSQALFSHSDVTELPIVMTILMKKIVPIVKEIDD